MKLYSYWDNSKGWHSSLVFECEASDIIEADKKLKETKNIDASKNFMVSCTSEEK